MRIFIFLFLNLFISVKLFCIEFEISDKRIGDKGVNYVNPEISPFGNYMLWIEVDTTNGISGRVWQCGINPNTGDLIPSNGKGFNPFFTNIYARPADWGVDSIGLFYVGATFQGQIKFVRPTSATSAIVNNVAAPIINKRRVFYPSQLPGVNKRFVSYILNDSVNGFSSSNPLNDTFQLRLLDIDNPVSDYLIEEQANIYPATVPMDVIVPRWIKGSPYLTYGFRDSNGKAQAKEFAAFEPEKPPIPVTNDLSNKIDGYPVLNSENGNQYFMSGINATDTAYFYKRTEFGAIFVKNEEVVPQTVNLKNPAFNQSHEPFIFNNQLYSVFQINNYGGNFFETTFNQPGEIWLTTIDQSTKKMWLLSEFDSTLSISEPEPYIGNGKVWVFYSAVKIEPSKPSLKRQFQLRICETPMNITSINDYQKLNENKLSVYPNPAENYIYVNFFKDGVRIYDMKGEEYKSIIVNGTGIIDLSVFIPGVYILKSGYDVVKFMVVR
ncbi:MAG: T9SS type A sorting domain-containing protein [Bacteroidetes bacterium]|nr:T9SS type A sorting domain-containing protein [Bacteroidota bacterium]